METGYSTTKAAQLAAGPEYALFHDSFIGRVNMMPYDSEFVWVDVNNEEELLMYKKSPASDEVVDLLAKAATFDGIARSSSVMRKSAGQGLRGSGRFNFTLSHQLILHYYNTYLGKF